MFHYNPNIDISKISTDQLKKEYKQLVEATEFIDKMVHNYGNVETDHYGNTARDKLIKEIGKRCVNAIE